MKKILFIFLCLAMGISCSDNTIITEEDSGDNLTTGCLKIYLQSPEASTRSGWVYDDYFPNGHIYSNDSKHERWMHNLCLAYFDEDFLLEQFIVQVNYKTDGTNPQNAIDNYEKYKPGDAPEEYYLFTLGLGNLPLTTGAHYFYILCNLPEDYVTEIAAFCNERKKELTKDEFEERILNYTIYDIARYLYAYDKEGNKFNQSRCMMTNITSPAPHYMADKSLIVNGMGYPAVNGISMDIGKSFAKVSVAYIPKNESDKRLSDVQYRMVNDPKQMYMLPNIFKGQVHTPHYAKKVGVNGYNDYFDEFFNSESKISYQADEAHEADETDYSFSWRPANLTTTGEKTFAYCLENGNETPSQGNSTMVLVRAKYIPENWWSTNDTPGTESNDGTFWRIRNTEGKYYSKYYNSEPSVGAGEKAIKYTGGITYYPIWLTTDGKYMVERNHYYKIAITGVSSAGAPDLDSVIEPEALLVSSSTDGSSVRSGNSLPESATSIKWEQNN